MFHEPPGADRQGGGGGSAPFTICNLHDPRGKRPMRPRSVKLVLAVGRARMVAQPIEIHARVRQPDPVCRGRYPAIHEVGHASACSPRSMHRFRTPGAGALELPAPDAFGAG